MMRDANAGRIQGGFMDYPIAAYILSQGNYPNLKMARSYQPTVVGSLGLATRRTTRPCSIASTRRWPS